MKSTKGGGSVAGYLKGMEGDTTPSPKAKPVKKPKKAKKFNPNPLNLSPTPKKKK